jgi:hypothetical protein
MLHIAVGKYIPTSFSFPSSPAPHVDVGMAQWSFFLILEKVAAGSTFGTAAFLLHCLLAIIRTNSLKSTCPSPLVSARS